ncbi:MAG TPA: hypothetical protein VFJ13_01710 [Paracoccaceae bacterium]|nr:hypothetical protein [Paracoccaceae bacterium]
MSEEQVATKLDDLSSMLSAEFGKIRVEFGKIDARLTSLEKHSVTRSDVHSAVFQGRAFAAAAIVGTVVVLNAIGAFS